MVIPARKGTAGTWDAPTEWQTEDVQIPKGLDRAEINEIVGALATIQMGLNGDDYSQSYYPFYAKAVMPEAFNEFEKSWSEKKSAESKEWQFVKATYNSNDCYLKFSRFHK